MDNTSGNLYVFSSPFLPNQVVIDAGRQLLTQPEQRAFELAQAMGLPEPFTLAYSRPFENVALAERIVHFVLEEQGLHGGNRGLFGVSVTDAARLMEQVAERLDDAEASLEFARAFVTKAQLTLEQSKPLISELEQALTLLEYAAVLGDPLAPFLGGDVAWDLGRRRLGKPEVAHALFLRSRALYETAAERGAVRGFAQSGRVALEAGDVDAFLVSWEQYLDALPADGSMPEEEQDFLLGLLYAEFYSGSKLEPGAHPFFKQHARSLRARAKQLNLEPDFQRWLRDRITSLEQRLVERGKLPAVIIVALLALFVVKPALCMGLVAAVLFLFGIAGFARKLGRTVRGKRTEE
ncbi:GIY-YIG nuclease family protein [Burkholderia cenocepacia]|uniref:GIY-YIG nuclease family protein n=1 Tax=Burkholderia cenocepacia TaxID=95486 RepID=UPI0007616104|nr:GIY-YIG nuclease family protein [Burkholderia cenocepacia]KWU24730.1 hypothetical protein AS149_31790 [Burkholderia cenocepacia]